MIVWNVFDTAGLYQLTCTSEEAAKNAVKTYGRGWSARAVDTDYGDKFVDTVLYIVAIKKNSYRGTPIIKLRESQSKPDEQIDGQITLF